MKDRDTVLAYFLCDVARVTVGIGLDDYQTRSC